ncbi:MAG: tetratricopeptide repeat protein, partial [Candidatus Zixiibacteriota bacterium]
MNAEAMFLKAIELEPNFAKAHAWLSVVHTQIYAWYIDRTEERLAAAREAADRSLEIVPELSEGQGALAWYHFAALNDHDLALEEFTKLREKEPNDQTIELCIAMIEETRGKWDNAMEGYRRAMKLNPRSATLCLEYGNALFYCRRYSEAETLYNRAIELRPDSRQAYISKSTLYIFWKGDFDTARQVLQEALQRIDRWLELTITEAILELTASNFDRALTLLTESGETTDRLTYENAFYQNLKGSVYRYLNEVGAMRASYDSAQIILQELIHVEPEEPYNHTELGVAYAGLGRKHEAIQAGKHAVELLPVSTDALNGADLVRNLAMIYAIVGEHDLAVEQLEYLLSI